MANGKVATPSYPASYHDFYKTNGSDTLVVPLGDSLTRQEFAAECDINSIMRQYEVHAGTGPGNLQRQANVAMQYVDFAEMPQDLLSFMEFMDSAQRSFMTLPAHVRKEFDNSPHLFVDYAADPLNIEQMREWGLAPPAKPQETPAGGPGGSSPGENKSPGGSPEGSTHGST